MIDNSLITAKSISYKINENKLFHNLSFELGEGCALLIKGKDRLSSLQEIKMMLSFAKDLSLLLNAQAVK